MAFNHDGVYSDFTETLKQWAKTDQPMDISTLKPTRVSFDNSSIYDDYDVLSLWLAQAPKDRPAALYYNTVYLHAGVHKEDKNWWKQENAPRYQAGYRELTENVTRFFNDLKNSGRRAVVVVVGEHGAALHGSPVQISTIREIPLPGITTVPAAIKIFGPGFNDRVALRNSIDEPVSYYGLYTLINAIMREGPYGMSPETLSSLAENIPKTEEVGMSPNGVVMQRQDGFYYKNTWGAWSVLPEYIRVPTPNLFSPEMRE
jgi:hypothetical protein